MSRRSIAVIVAAGVVLSLLLAGVVSFYASTEPDGLNKVAADQGFDQYAQDSANAGLPTAGYDIAGIDNERLSGGLAGVLGVLVVLAVAFGLFWYLGRGKRSSTTAASHANDAPQA